MSGIVFRSQLAAIPVLAGKVVVTTVLLSQLAALPVYRATTEAIRLNTPIEAARIIWADGYGILWADGSRMVY